MAFTEWLSSHYCTFSEDLGQPSPGCSRDRVGEVVADGRMAARHHPPVGRACADSRGEDGKVAYPCSSRRVVDMRESPTLLSSLPLSQDLCQVRLSSEERAGGRCLLPAMS